MTTGYTYVLIEKPETTFAQFALRCARAFGACIEMRDESIDRAPPAIVEPAAYVRDALDKAYEAHREAEALTLDEAEIRAEAEYASRLESRREYEERHARETALFTKMLEEIDAWVPPTKEHEGLKAFMRQQVETSISKRYDYAVPKQSGAEWLESLRRTTAESVTRAAREWEKERVSAAERTAWLKALRESLVVKEATR